jgi:hypothetical protein
MEKWRFRINFSGLTAFVIRPDHSGARVILMNALKINNQRHQPEFRFDARDVTESPWKIPLYRITKDATHTSHYGRVWHLKFLDLNFLPAPGVTLNQNFKLNTANIHQLVNLATIFAGPSKINSECLGPRPPKNLVLIRVPLRHGELSSKKLAFDGIGPRVNCRFGPMEPPYITIPHRQFCAIEMALEFTVNRGPLTLIGVPFSKKMSSGIAFQPRRGMNEVVVELENRPIDQEKFLTIASRERKMDEDFSLHYNLTQTPPPRKKRIVPYYDIPGPFESMNCIIGRFPNDSRA